MVFERPNLSDVDDEGRQDVEAPPPEWYARKALERARAGGEHVTRGHLADLVAHLRRVRGAEH